VRGGLIAPRGVKQRLGGRPAAAEAAAEGIGVHSAEPRREERGQKKLEREDFAIILKHSPTSSLPKR